MSCTQIVFEWHCRGWLLSRHKTPTNALLVMNYVVHSIMIIDGILSIWWKRIQFNMETSKARFLSWISEIFPQSWHRLKRPHWWCHSFSFSWMVAVNGALRWKYWAIDDTLVAYSHSPTDRPIFSSALSSYRSHTREEPAHTDYFNWDWEMEPTPEPQSRSSIIICVVNSGYELLFHFLRSLNNCLSIVLIYWCPYHMGHLIGLWLMGCYFWTFVLSIIEDIY